MDEGIESFLFCHTIGPGLLGDGKDYIECRSIIDHDREKALQEVWAYLVSPSRKGAGDVPAM